MKEETYCEEVRCSNCGYGHPYNAGLYIPKGKKEKDWSKETECSTCGCKGTLYFYGRCSKLEKLTPRGIK